MPPPQPRHAQSEAKRAFYRAELRGFEKHVYDEVQLAGEPYEEQDTDYEEVIAGLRRMQAAAAAAVAGLGCPCDAGVAVAAGLECSCEAGAPFTKHAIKEYVQRVAGDRW